MNQEPWSWWHWPPQLPNNTIVERIGRRSSSKYEGMSTKLESNQRFCTTEVFCKNLTWLEYLLRLHVPTPSLSKMMLILKIKLIGVRVWTWNMNGSSMCKDKTPSYMYIIWWFNWFQLPWHVSKRIPYQPNWCPTQVPIMWTSQCIRLH